MAKVYKEITFAEDYNRSFAEFKEDFADNWVFMKIPREKVEAEYKKAYAIATSNNGELQSTIKKSKGSYTDKTE